MRNDMKTLLTFAIYVWPIEAHKFYNWQHDYNVINHSMFNYSVI